MTTVSNRTSAFYCKGLYDPSLPHLDYLTAGSQPLRKGLNLDQATQPESNGKRLVVTEQKDPAVCGAMCIQGHEDVGVEAVLSGTTGFKLYMPPHTNMISTGIEPRRGLLRLW